MSLGWNQTQAILMGGERSQNCVIPAEEGHISVACPSIIQSFHEILNRLHRFKEESGYPKNSWMVLVYEVVSD